MKIFFKISVLLISLSFLSPLVKANPFEDLSFDTLVKCLVKRKLIEFGGNEYVVLKEGPKLPSSLYDGEKVSTNPCFSLGLGPRLLSSSDVERLPKVTKFFCFRSFTDTTGRYITVNFTAESNPHWPSMYTYPEPFKDPKNRYWHEEFIKNSLIPLRTVNFLLEKVG